MLQVAGRTTRNPAFIQLLIVPFCYRLRISRNPLFRREPIVLRVFFAASIAPEGEHPLVPVEEEHGYIRGPSFCEEVGGFHQVYFFVSFPSYTFVGLERMGALEISGDDCEEDCYCCELKQTAQLALPTSLRALDNHGRGETLKCFPWALAMYPGTYLEQCNAWAVLCSNCGLTEKMIPSLILSSLDPKTSASARTAVLSCVI